MRSNRTICANKEIYMSKEEIKLLSLKNRAIKIKARGRYLESPGVYKKVLRQIKRLENQ